MILALFKIALQCVEYGLIVALLTIGGNIFCRWVLVRSRLSSVGAAGSTVVFAAGSPMGVFERTIIMIGLIAGSWEIIAAVIALKTVARFKELDERMQAEYFLVGSLSSVLWAIACTVLLLVFEVGLRPRSGLQGIVAAEQVVAPHSPVSSSS